MRSVRTSRAALSFPPGTLAFRILSEQPSPRFLGLTAAERNERVVQRYTTLCTSASSLSSQLQRSTLTVPAGVIITPALIAALPPPNGTWRLDWDPEGPPIVWTGAGATSSGPPATRRLPDGAAFDVSGAAARRQSAWRLLRASGKPTDAWLSRHVHRKISRICSYALLHLGLTANHATLLTFLVGAAAAWLMTQTTHRTMIAGALLFWFASVADGIDGEMARLTLTESARGEQLDTAVDHATHALGFAGVMVGWWRQGIDPAGWTLATAVAVGLPAVMLWGMHLVRRARAVNRARLRPDPGRGLDPGASEPFFVDTRPLEYAIRDAARATGAPLLRLVSWIYVIFRREASVLAFLVVALVTGQRAVYPALIGGGLMVVATTWLVYRGPIERALESHTGPTPFGTPKAS
jgi:hypothetical protein